MRGLIVDFYNNLPVPISINVIDSGSMNNINRLNTIIPEYQSKEVYLEERQFAETDGWDYKINISEFNLGKKVGQVQYSRDYTQKACNNNLMHVSFELGYQISAVFDCNPSYRWVHHVIIINPVP